MAKDDYEVIVYKILVYYYACLKREIVFDPAIFKGVICKDVKAEAYLIDIFLMMQEDGLLSGVRTQRVWGDEKILISDPADAKITSAGIAYLKENSRMQVERYTSSGVSFRKDVYNYGVSSREVAQTIELLQDNGVFIEVF